jgi:hypothetical protein
MLRMLKVRNVIGVMTVLLGVLLAGTVPLLADSSLNGTITDAQGRVVVDASVSVLTSDRTTVASATTNAEGRFVIAGLPAGSYLIVVRKGAFEERRAAVSIAASGAQVLSMTLQVAPLTDTASVTASRGEVETIGMTGQPINIISEDDVHNPLTN